MGEKSNSGPLMSPGSSAFLFRVVFRPTTRGGCPGKLAPAVAFEMAVHLKFARD